MDELHLSPDGVTARRLSARLGLPCQRGACREPAVMVVLHCKFSFVCCDRCGRREWPGFYKELFAKGTR